MLSRTLLLKTQPCNEVLANAIVHVQNTFRQYVPCQVLPFNASGTSSQKDLSEGEKKIKESHILGITEVNMARQARSLTSH